jgi:hypothetical protein
VIPQKLVTQVKAFLSAPGFEPALGSPAVYRYVGFEGEGPNPYQKEAEEWVARQRGLQAEAEGLVTELETQWPTPLFDSVIEGKAVFPPHHGTEWWMILVGVPWARDLDVAVYRAREALELPSY